MPIDTSPSQVATNALASLPFSNIIGGPLTACIEAQAMAAKTSWNFIQDVGLNTDPKTGEKKTVNVSFQFIKDGRVAQLNIPLLTIVPIPYIAIQSIDISFKANINASASNSKVENENSSIEAGLAGSTSLSLGLFKVNANFHANYSSKKDSTATQDSKYSVEYTMDIAVKAGQDSMPAGLAKVLEILGNSLDVCNPSGTLDVNSLEFKGSPNDHAMLIVTYKNKDGLFEPSKIQIPGQKGTVDGDNMIFQLPIQEGKTTSYMVGVSGIDKKVIVKTLDTYTDQKNRELARIEREEKDKEHLNAMQIEIKDRREQIDTQHQKELEASQESVRKLEEKQAQEEKEKQEKKE
ncbi:MAG: DUF2589 domain-containing protein [Bacteroidales bacterium]